jgi:hypothetical protein
MQVRHLLYYARIPTLMISVLAVAIFIAACGEGPVEPDSTGFDDDVAESSGAGGDVLEIMNAEGVLGNSLPGTWRPFSADSPWNQTISSSAQKHPDSDAIISLMASRSPKLTVARSYTIPVWVVDSSKLSPVAVKSDKIFDWWDTNLDGWSDVGVPLTPSMWQEQTNDGHICIIDPSLHTAWEMSRYSWPSGSPPQCTTFNIWNVRLTGVGNPNEGNRWGTRGGRASGFPEIAGLVRPEELDTGEIRHALVFTYSDIRRADDGRKMFYWPPACRSDGSSIGPEHPIMGMRFQLDPTLTDTDFNRWGLTSEAKIVARALQKYGMFLGDRGGDMKIQVQLLSKDPNQHRALWEDHAPGLYNAIEKIPTNELRIVYTGEPTLKAN